VDYRAVYRGFADNFLAISPTYGRFLYATAHACKATRIVEFGTSMGISTIYLAAALRDNGGGHLISSELEPGKVARARANLDAAGLGDLVDIREGDALETLKDVGGEVDLLLIDGAFSLYLPVLKLVEPRLKPGALVFGENAFEQGYLDYVRNPANGYVSMRLPIDEANGNEFTLRKVARMTRQNLSEIKSSDVQILFIDLQKQLVARSKTTAPDTLSLSAAVLAQLAKLFQLPVILSVVPEAKQAPELLPELAEQTRNDPQFLRISANPFLDGATREALASSGRKTLIIAGFSTEAVVLHAVIGAINAGYHVYVPVDACGGMSERTEAAALRQIEAVGGVTTSTATLATARAPDFSTEMGKAMLNILRLSLWAK
jgi:predicted O-methyltransferase YrrM/nicotinamidase-related amidase